MFIGADSIRMIFRVALYHLLGEYIKGVKLANCSGSCEIPESKRSYMGPPLKVSEVWAVG